MRRLLAATFAAAVLSAAPAAGAQTPPAPAPPAADTSTKDKNDELPLATTRTVEFETSEGTWMSLDVSPDGRTIVFELLGDLYTMPVTGGAATRITSGPAFDSQPRWSPDGKRIAFYSTRSGSYNIWSIRPDGSDLRQLTATQDKDLMFPLWSPSGDRMFGTFYTLRTAFLFDPNQPWSEHAS